MILDGWCLQVLGVLSENFRTMNLFYYVHCNSASLLSILNYGNARAIVAGVRWVIRHQFKYACTILYPRSNTFAPVYNMNPTYVSQIECRK